MTVSIQGDLRKEVSRNSRELFETLSKVEDLISTKKHKRRLWGSSGILQNFLVKPSFTYGKPILEPQDILQTRMESQNIDAYL